MDVSRMYFCDPNSPNNTRYIEVNGGPLTINGGTLPVSVSSLNVSSINGAQPGGGGGGVGPNPVFSTVTTQLDATIGGSVACAGVTLNGANATTTTLAVNASNFLSVANGVNTGNIAGCAQIANGPNPVSISSLNVSSINGAAPSGGGGPPPAITSTISSLVNLSSINFGSPGIVNMAGSLQVADYFGASAISTLRIDSIVPGGSVVIPLAILSTVNGPVSVSSLTVSSINGAQPGGTGSLYPKVSTIGVGGGGVQTVYTSISTNSIAQFTTPFDVEAGHNYQISWNYSLAPSATATYGQYASFYVGGPTVAPIRTINTDLSISTVNQGSIVFTGTGSGGQANLFCVTNTTTAATLDLGYTTTNIELVDLGPIAGSF